MQRNNQTDVVTVGESMVLFQSIGDKGIKYESLFTKSLAGAESNVAIGLTRLGKKARWISKVGKDPFGDFILSTLAGEGVDVTQTLRDEQFPSAVYFKDTRGLGGGDPAVYYYRKSSAASNLKGSDVREEWLEGARHLHITGITPALSAGAAATVRKVMGLAKEMGLTVSFDPNLRRKLWGEEGARKVLLSLIPLCDVFLPGMEEAEFLVGKHPIEEYGSKFLNMGPKVVAFKLGAEGSIGFSGGSAVKATPYVVDRVIDTVGAGDAFAAGFLSVYVEEQADMTSLSLEKALNRANIMGALATQFKGDWEGLPTLDELNMLQTGENEIKR